MKGLIFNVRKYSVHDGPGIRVTFFMKGCPLKCLWCHNPEGISPLPETAVQTGKVGEKEFRHVETVGKYYSIEDIMDVLEGEKVFIENSSGGVTFSGGEPLLQHEFLIEALNSCKVAGFHTAVDTSGYAPADIFRSVIPDTDLFLFDIKHLDPVKHSELTGMSNKLILRNYMMILESGKEMMIRFPVIPGYNDDYEHLDRLRKFISVTGNESLSKICLLPFHRIGSGKYKRFSIPYNLNHVEPPSPERMKELKDFFSQTGIKVKIGG